MKKILLFAFILTANLIFSQNKELKWQFSTGMHADIYRYPIDIPKNMFEFKKANFAPPLSRLSIARHMFVGFSSELKFAANKVAYDPSIEATKYLMVNGIFNLKYSFVNDYIIKLKSPVEPYFKGGLGLTYLDVHDNDKFLTTWTYGGGIAIWPTNNRKFGIQIEELYHRIPMFRYNIRDYFEHSVSLTYNFGMKDTDHDGVPDKDDRCPDVAGPKELQGCPDSDGDGIADKDDRCPEEKGPKDLQGCPDSDGDGVADIDDICPETPGEIIYSGCPDTDGDSIPDNIDSCPTVPGSKEFIGCPDRDGDGVQDKYDKCPDVPGLLMFEGCPDTDGDGVPDDIDKCPEEPGPASNNGCPEEEKRQEIEQEIAFHAKSIFFKIDKFEILPKSFPMLNSIADIMKDNPNETFVIEGHTDITGTEEHNLKLSRERANSVKEYLVSQGVNPDKLESYGFGIKYPIATNKTAEGRAKNRRTDITIKR